MSGSEYYQEMSELAKQKRLEHNLTTAQIGLAKVRELYKQEGIEIHTTRRPVRNLKAAYFNDKNGCDVLLNMSLPQAPRLFAMVHELKHHYKDRDKLGCLCVEVTETSPIIEIGAEVFAAEFIFPLHEFEQHLVQCGVTGSITPEDVVHLMYRSPAQVSYQFMQKCLERLGLIAKGQFKHIQFHNLHKQIYGSPHYRQPRSRV